MAKFELHLKAPFMCSILNPLDDYKMNMLKLEKFCLDNNLEVSKVYDRMQEHDIRQHDVTNCFGTYFEFDYSELVELEIDHLFLLKHKHTIRVESDWLRKFIEVDIETYHLGSGVSWRRGYVDNGWYIRFSEFVNGAKHAAAVEALEQSKKINSFTKFVNKLVGNDK